MKFFIVLLPCLGLFVLTEALDDVKGIPDARDLKLKISRGSGTGLISFGFAFVVLVAFALFVAVMVLILRYKPEKDITNKERNLFLTTY